MMPSKVLGVFEFRADGARPSVVELLGPYRQPAEDVEAKLDALEVAALQAALARRTWHVRAAVVLCVVGPIAAGVAVIGFWLSFEKTPVPAPPHTPRCESHVVHPSVGAPFSMTICR